MSARALSFALISTDPGFGEKLRTSPPFESGECSVEAEIEAPYSDITDVDLEKLRGVKPEVIILDLESDLAIGLKFAEFLSDAGLGAVLLAAGPPQSPEMLMDVMHAGFADFIPKPIQPEAVQKAMKSVRRKLGRTGPQGEERSPGQVVVCFSPKGGTGCTSVCTNLGVDVHRATRSKTLLLDLDLELGETALQLGKDPRFNMVDLVRNFHRVDSDLLASYIEHHESGVDLLSAPYRPTDFEALSGERVAEILYFLQRQYDYIFVDAPKALNPALNPATVASIKVADYVLLITTLDLPSIRNVTRCLPLLKDIGQDRPDDWIRLVVNRYDPRGIISLAQVEETTGHSVYATVRNDYNVVMSSINEGKPAVMAGVSDFAHDIRDLAGKITGIETEPVRRGLGGWVKSLRSKKRTSPRPKLESVPNE